MDQLFVGIPYLLFASLIGRFSSVYAYPFGTYPNTIEKCYCKILVRVNWYISFGLDDVVAEMMLRDPERHIKALNRLLDSSNLEYADLAFSTLHLHFRNDNVLQGLEAFIENLESEVDQKHFRSKITCNYFE